MATAVSIPMAYYGGNDESARLDILGDQYYTTIASIDDETGEDTAFF